LVLNPTATFVGEKGMGVGAFYLMDKTARAPQGIAGHHYLFLNATYGLSPKPMFWFTTAEFWGDTKTSTCR
jgi:hypothetical protein